MQGGGGGGEREHKWVAQIQQLQAAIISLEKVGNEYMQVGGGGVKREHK